MKNSNNVNTIFMGIMIWTSKRETLTKNTNIMKNIIKPLSFIILLSLMAVYTSFSQDISFGYDAAGNRTSRTITVGGERSTAEDDFFDEETNKFKKEPASKFKDMLGEMGITLYPNPTAGQVIVQITNLQDDLNCRIEVYNMDGEVIIQRINLTEYTDIDLSDSPYGTYILRIIAGDDVCEWKVIKR